MDKLVLFCKSWKNDIQRCVKLSESVQQYNVDGLPFYVSVPSDDVKMFKNLLPRYTEIIADEDITDTGGGWVGQQYVKAKFYKLRLCDYYVCLDSDSYFFKEFRTSDFMYDEDIPYMVMHERESFYEWCDRFGEEYLGFNPRGDHREEYISIRKYLNAYSGSKIWHFGPSPFIWKASVWEWLNTKYGIDEMFAKHPNEMKWYGEGALVCNQDYRPCNPLFKVFHYKQQYDFYKQLEWSEEHFKQQYLGIVMQSNWGSPLEY